MGFPAVLSELQLYGMEEHIICPRLLFFLSIINGMGFPAVLSELQLYAMEEHIICPRLLFLQMKTHFMGGHTQVVAMW